MVEPGLPGAADDSDDAGEPDLRVDAISSLIGFDTVKIESKLIEPFRSRPETVAPVRRQLQLKLFDQTLLRAKFGVF